MYVKPAILALLAIGLIGSATGHAEQPGEVDDQAVAPEDYYHPNPTVTPYRPKPTYIPPSIIDLPGEPAHTEPSYPDHTEYPTTETGYEPRPTYVPEPHHQCTNGKYKCQDSGKSPVFYICNFGEPVKMTCAAGTVCFNRSEGSIVCDHAIRALDNYDNDH
ncbi:hypothetical protein H4R35_002505 [Dimargaris xerosporica]|nr:hypothetical protein H4R35_002505 [Dimargaris xerosporica]